MGGEKVGEFETIYNTYLKDVFRYSRSLTMDEHLAEEITEETFFRALRSLDSFRGDCEVRVWLCGIARNVWLSESKKRGRFADEELVFESLDDGTDMPQSLAIKTRLFACTVFYTELRSRIRRFFRCAFSESCRLRK
jgi:RNA polymerase sigma-70 factor (ECF subfamily)